MKRIKNYKLYRNCNSKLCENIRTDFLTHINPALVADLFKSINSHDTYQLMFYLMADYFLRLLANNSVTSLLIPLLRQIRPKLQVTPNSYLKNLIAMAISDIPMHCLSAQSYLFIFMRYSHIHSNGRNFDFFRDLFKFSLLL